LEASEEDGTRMRDEAGRRGEKGRRDGRDRGGKEGEREIARRVIRALASVCARAQEREREREREPGLSSREISLGSLRTEKPREKVSPEVLDTLLR